MTGPISYEAAATYPRSILRTFPAPPQELGRQDSHVPGQNPCQYCTARMPPSSLRSTYQQPSNASAPLAVQVGEALHDAVGNGIYAALTVLQHDHRVAAAEFKHHGLELHSTSPRNFLSCVTTQQQSGGSVLHTHTTAMSSQHTGRVPTPAEPVKLTHRIRGSRTSRSPTPPAPCNS